MINTAIKFGLFRSLPALHGEMGDGGSRKGAKEDSELGQRSEHLCAVQEQT